MNVTMAWIFAMTMLLAMTQLVASTAFVTLALREMESTAVVSLISVLKGTSQPLYWKLPTGCIDPILQNFKPFITVAFQSVNIIFH